MNRCYSCNQQWPGVIPAHCNGCHVTFTHSRAFDAHRGRGRCADPAEAGLVPYPGDIWGFPTSPAIESR